MAARVLAQIAQGLAQALGGNFHGGFVMGSKAQPKIIRTGAVGVEGFARNKGYPLAGGFV